jgi:hypothetical protein
MPRISSKGERRQDGLGVAKLGASRHALAIPDMPVGKITAEMVPRILAPLCGH